MSRQQGCLQAVTLSLGPGRMLLMLQDPRAGTGPEAVYCRNVLHPHCHAWRAGEEGLFWFCLLKRDYESAGAHYRKELDL